MMFDSKKIVAALGFVSVSVVTVSAAGQVEVIDLVKEEVKQGVSFLPVKPVSYQGVDSGNSRLEARLSQDLLNLVRAKTGLPFLAAPRGGLLPNDGNGGGVNIQATKLTTSSVEHVDHRHSGEAMARGDRVAFIPLNTNKEAWFEADGQCFPLVEGSLVAFDNGLRHRTVVKGGHVKLAGPFHLASMDKVGVSCDTDGGGLNTGSCSGTYCGECDTTSDCGSGICSEQECCYVPTSGGGGDPHFMSFGPVPIPFSFHGGCDLGFLKSVSACKGQGLRIVIRTTVENSLSAEFSYISSAAVQVGNEVLEFNNDGACYLNGELVEALDPASASENQGDEDEIKDDTVPGEKVASGFVEDARRHAATDPVHVRLAGYPVTKGFKGKRGKIVSYELRLDDKVVHVRARAGILSIDVSGTFDDAEGLLGTSGKQGLISRQGKDLTSDWLSYGESWQVPSTEPMLFRDARFPQHPQQCTYDVDATANVKHGRRLRGIVEAEPVDAEAAAEACAGLTGAMKEFCIADCMSMGLEMAEDPFYVSYN